MQEISELRIGILGNVDSGKTTLISVLKNNKLDNGRGLSRQSILKHKHEKETGRTSSITHHYLQNTDYNNNILTFIDLAGHEKYYKTTVFGANSCSLDYILLIVGANMGVSRMTIEHLLLTLILKKPFMIIISKIDLCPPRVLKQTINDINTLLQKYKAKKLLIDNDIKIFKSNNNITPCIQVSNVTGLNIDILRTYLYSLYDINKWDTLKKKPLSGIVEEVFLVNGVGIVITGTINKGIVNKGDTVLLGPFNGDFKEVQIKSIHNNFKNSINFINAGCSGCFNIKSVDRKFQLTKNIIKRGLIIMDKSNNQNTYSIFEAKIKILHHPSTIKKNYQTMIHCNSIKQTAKIIHIDTDIMRIGDQSKVQFKFIKKPELIKENTQIMFREGKTKGIGIITRCIS
jgi:small GTP-binding protein